MLEIYTQIEIQMRHFKPMKPLLTLIMLTAISIFTANLITIDIYIKYLIFFKNIFKIKLRNFIKSFSCK
ncbi:hypothetical protein BG74_09500 [Sodalis-like endosymbiont of Proechinophthirus fluctus]|nr:hypothetical protein BG74_09500 [Sodalis-like endosymbiont of Proechinophthirus fluctus]